MIPEVNTESIYFDVSVRVRGGEREVSDLRESTNAILRHNSGTRFIRKPFMCIERFQTQLRPKIMAFKVVCINTAMGNILVMVIMSGTTLWPVVGAVGSEVSPVPLLL